MFQPQCNPFAGCAFGATAEIGSRGPTPSLTHQQRIISMTDDLIIVGKAKGHPRRYATTAPKRMPRWLGDLVCRPRAYMRPSTRLLGSAW